MKAKLITSLSQFFPPHEWFACPNGEFQFNYPKSEFCLLFNRLARSKRCVIIIWPSWTRYTFRIIRAGVRKMVLVSVAEHSAKRTIAIFVNIFSKSMPVCRLFPNISVSALYRNFSFSLSIHIPISCIYCFWSLNALRDISSIYHKQPRINHLNWKFESTNSMEILTVTLKQLNILTITLK